MELDVEVGNEEGRRGAVGHYLVAVVYKQTGASKTVSSSRFLPSRLDCSHSRDSPNSLPAKQPSTFRGQV